MATVSDQVKVRLSHREATEVPPNPILEGSWTIQRSEIVANSLLLKILRASHLTPKILAEIFH
jgi:hypothetical protein